MKFFDDIEIGDARELGTHEFTAEEIVAFARDYDPQRFHLSEEGARDSQFGRLCASGWHTVCVWMQHNVADAQARLARAAETGQKAPRIGPSPGLDDLRWHRPVFVGDRITYRTTVVGKKELPHRPEWGLVNFRAEGVKADGELAMSFIGGLLVERRDRPAAG